MKTYKHLYEQIATFENLLRAFDKAKRHKRMKRHVAEFELNLEHNLLELEPEESWRLFGFWLPRVTIHATIPTMKDEKFAEYLPGIRRRWNAERDAWAQRRAHAWHGARRAAEVLRQFGATRVIAFGSLTRTGMFDARSDIDLAVQAISPDQFWDAYVQAAMVVGDFEFDLVDLDHCVAHLRDEILQNGVPL
ncbi:MAG: nucleotidyltransferase domain-containing protein [Chloroflexi bacterium]|nr:nucleotidyltransferase domain-containing protein [Chloroflexota bacterium]